MLHPSPSPLSKWMLRIVSRDYGDGVDTIVKGCNTSVKLFQKYRMLKSKRKTIQGRAQVLKYNFFLRQASSDGSIVKGSGHKCDHLLQTHRKRITFINAMNLKILFLFMVKKLFWVKLSVGYGENILVICIIWPSWLWNKGALWDILKPYQIFPDIH